MRVVVGLGAVALVLFLTLRALFGGGTVSWNQRLTLVIETPQGEVRGSAVTRVENVTSKGALVLVEARGTRSYWTGEAVAVEVLPGKWLFALLQSEGGTDAGHWVFAAYDLGTAVGADGYPSYDAAMAKLRAQPLDVPVPLPAEGMPMLVAFDEITDPKTVRRVDPRNLAAVFSEGVRLKAVTLEITDEPVTEGRIEGVLGWLRAIWPNQLGGRNIITIRAENIFANSLSVGNFSTEIGNP